MELYKEILLNVLSKQKIEVSFSDIKLDVKKIMEMECYKALRDIKDILEDVNLNDKECFMKIEKIVCLFEEMGDGIYNRHDFG